MVDENMEKFVKISLHAKSGIRTEGTGYPSPVPTGIGSRNAAGTGKEAP
jgi:hypothetical protein